LLPPAFAFGAVDAAVLAGAVFLTTFRGFEALVALFFPAVAFFAAFLPGARVFARADLRRFAGAGFLAFCFLRAFFF
jgi:hypothetical protein